MKLHSKVCDNCKRKSVRLYNELEKKLCRSCWDKENTPSEELDMPEYHTEESIRWYELQRELEAEPIR